ncbi:MAG: nucleoside triphosphate pyrophosphohydrolase, partial [bacterium]|nr:nucleoside triphosphate pyrophosphohydrolase [bacterium]
MDKFESYPPIERLRAIVEALRGPGGCPWDQEQTLQSITPHIIEEAYELVDAIERNNTRDIEEELGDVLLHVTMLSQMASEEGRFDMDSVAAKESEKMIRRHPHVFGDTTVANSDGVLETWEDVKSVEKKEKNEGLLDSVPNGLPALMRAFKLQKKAAKVGFDWPDVEGAFDKLIEEVGELKAELTQYMGEIPDQVGNDGKPVGNDGNQVGNDGLQRGDVSPMNQNYTISEDSEREGEAPRR